MNIDTWWETMLKLDKESLLQTCEVDSTTRDICSVDLFWKQKFKYDYTYLPREPEDITWKELYLNRERVVTVLIRLVGLSQSEDSQDFLDAVYSSEVQDYFTEYFNEYLNDVFPGLKNYKRGEVTYPLLKLNPVLDYERGELRITLIFENNIDFDIDTIADDILGFQDLIWNLYPNELTIGHEEGIVPILPYLQKVCVFNY